MDLNTKVIHKKLDHEIKNLETLFEQFLSQKSPEIYYKIVDAEKSRAVDYVLRMTGQIDYALKVFHESSIALANQIDEFFDLNTLRLRLYSTLRSFAADNWNADVRQLALDDSADPELLRIGSPTETGTRYLNQLQGWEREPLILKLRCGFDFYYCGQIMGIDAVSFEASYLESLKKLTGFFQDSSDLIEEKIADLKPFDLDEASSVESLAISQIIGDIGDTKINFINRGLIFFAVSIVTALSIYLLFFR